MSRELWITLGKKILGREFGHSCSKGEVDEIRKRLSKHMWDLMEKHNEEGPPFLENPKTSAFVRSRKIIDVRYRDMGYQEIKGAVGGEGGLLIRKNGFIIRIDKGGPKRLKRRRRTTLAHEIGHTFLFDLKEEPPKPYCQSDGLSWKEEGVAYEIGRRILLPKESVKNYLSNNPSLHSFLEVMEEFQVTADVLARSIFHDYGMWTPGILFAEVHEKKFDIPKDQNHRFWHENVKREKKNQIVDAIENIEHPSLVYHGNKNSYGIACIRLTIEGSPYIIEIRPRYKDQFFVLPYAKPK